MHPLFGADVSTLFRLLKRDGPVSPRHMPSLAIAGLSAVARTPFRLIERAEVARRRRQSAPMPPPIFIVGHWRSGTTHLYNILSKANFGYVTPFAAGMPLEYQTLGRWLRPLLVRMLPETRYIDQVAVGPESPQEDEIPLGSITPISFYHGVYFPRHFERHLKRSLFLDDCTPEEIAEWEVAFRHFMEKIWLDQGKQPLIKNPTYSARIPQIRRMFPDAQFIHIYRHPQAVFRSTRRFYRKLIDKYAWQKADEFDLDQLVLQSYRRMMDRIESDKQSLPASQFVELRFEDLETRPLDEIERLYRQLDLGDMSPWRGSFERYLESVEGFEKTFIPDAPDEHIMIERHCGGLLDRFGYATLDPGR